MKVDDEILRLIAAENFEFAATAVASYCRDVDRTSPSALETTVDFLNRAQNLARSVRAHLSADWEQVATARRFFTPVEPERTVDISG